MSSTARPSSTQSPCSAPREGHGATGAAPDGARWRALALLALALMLAMTTWFSASAVIPQLRDEWGLGSTAVAWLTIAVQLGFVTGALTAALLNLSDVFPPRWVIFGGAVGAAVVNALVVLGDGLAAGLPLRFATGFCLAAVYAPALKLMSTWFAKGRGVALGVMVGALTVGSAAPHLINGLGGLDWRVVVLATSALTLAGGLVAGFAVDDGPHPFPPGRFDPRQVVRVFRNRGVRLATCGYLGHMWELYAMWAWFLVFVTEALARRGGDPGSTAAYVTFAVIAIGALGCYLGGVLGDRVGRTALTASLMALSGLCAISIGLLLDGPLWLLVAVALVWGFAVIGDSAQFSTIVTELGDQAYVGTALTLQLAVGFTLTVSTIWLVPVLESAVGWEWAFAFLAIGPLFGTLAMLRLRSLPEAAGIAGGRG